MTALQLVVSSETTVAVSRESGKLRAVLMSMLGAVSRSVAFGVRHEEARLALDQAFLDASYEDWDCHGAKQAHPLSYYHARRFIAALPTTLPVPEFGVDPDGELSIEWYRAPRRVFSASVGRNGRLTYAGLFGRSESHGTEYSLDEIPDSILANVGRLFGEEGAQLTE